MRLPIPSILSAALMLLPLTASAEEAEKPLSAAELLAQAPAEAWRSVDPQRLALLVLDSGTVYFELAPQFAPGHVEQLRELIAANYFEGLAVLRSQDNYVAQWGDPLADEPERARSLGDAKRLKAEFDQASTELGAFTPAPDGDVYAPTAGFIEGFPVGRDEASGRSWLLHCYGMLGAGRDESPDSGSAAQLYVVTGHAPRHLDRNVTLLGRVLEGIEHLSSLPRGRGALGFYTAEQLRPKLKGMRLAADMKEADRPHFQVMRTDSETFASFIQARRYRREAWFAHPAGRIEVCNVPVPTRRSQ
jgi:peptidylprolyl isomerase